MGYVYYGPDTMRRYFGEDVIAKLQSDPVAARKVGACLHFGLVRLARRIVNRIPGPKEKQ